MKGGILRTKNTTATRHAVAALAVVTMVALPLLLLGGTGSSPTASAGPTKHAARSSSVEGRQQRHLRRMMLVGKKVPSVPTPTSTVPAPVPTTSALESAPSAVPVTSPAKVPTVAPVIPATTTTTTSAPQGSSASGLATWYAWRSGQCASPTLALGTTVSVRNVATGATASCVVTDREASNPGRIIDLDTSVFSSIAPLSAGAVSVVVSW